MPKTTIPAVTFFDAKESIGFHFGSLASKKVLA
jgi:hypothetical protein